VCVGNVNLKEIVNIDVTSRKDMRS